MKQPSIKVITLKNLVPFFLLLIVVLTLVVGLNFRTFGKSLIEEKVMNSAGVIMAGLTSHMKAGIMEKRDYFLDEITSMYEIESVRIIRSEALTRQFGEGRKYERAADPNTQEVLDGKAPFFRWQEIGSELKLRAIIPYTATTEGNLNCLQCHNVEAGSVLGAVEMNVDVTEHRLKTTTSLCPPSCSHG